MKRLGIIACAFVLATWVGTAATKAQDALVEFHVLSPDLAVKLAQATVEACRQNDFQVAVAVVDRFGVPQAMIRDRYAGPHSPDTATRKAWTAVSFRTDTTELVGNTQAGTPQAGARDVTNALMLGGGVLIRAGGTLVGAVGVSGAPTGKEDAACAKSGIEAIQSDLPL